MRLLYGFLLGPFTCVIYTRLLFVLLLVSVHDSSSAQESVDTKIAVNTITDNKTFALIISNENYKYEQPVPFALNDGDIFRLYCEKTLGIPADNIKYQPDASLNDMRIQFSLLEKKVNAFDGEARAIVYYSGHGMPSDDDKSAYLLPVDGNSTLPVSGMSVTDLYKQLGRMKSRQTIVFLDACFSGARRDGQMLTSSRGVAIKAKEAPVTGNMVVFSAAQGNETAFPYKEKHHGLFTYYILEQLQQQGGHVSLGELSDYVTKQVSRISIMKNEKSQTPSVTASSSVEGWRNWMFTEKPATSFIEYNPQKSASAPSPSNRDEVAISVLPSGKSSANLRNQKKPTIMILPSDNWCEMRYFMTTYNNQGKKVSIPDYQLAFQQDTELGPVISKIGGLLTALDYSVKDAEQEIKNINQRTAEDNVTSSKSGSAKFAESPLDLLKKRIKSDVLIQISWQMNKAASGRSITFSLEAFDTYTRKRIASSTGTTAASSDPIQVILEQAVKEHIAEFDAQMTKWYQDQQTNGREIVLTIRCWDSWENDLETTYGGEELIDCIQNWLKSHCVGGVFNLSDGTESFAQFEQVRIPLFDEKGNALDARGFATQLRKYLSNPPYGITTKVMQRGLGEAIIVLGEK